RGERSACALQRFRQAREVPGRVVEVDGLLRVEPELGRGSEGGAWLTRHFSSHGGPTVDDAVAHLDFAGEMICQLPLRYPERNQELFAEDLTRGGRLPASGDWSHRASSVVVPDVDLSGTGIGPAEDHPPLIVDPYAVASCQFSFQPFEPVARRRGEICQHRSIVEHIELPSSHPRHVRPADVLREPPFREESFDDGVGEALDRHRNASTESRYTCQRYSRPASRRRHKSVSGSPAAPAADRSTMPPRPRSASPPRWRCSRPSAAVDVATSYAQPAT